MRLKSVLRVKPLNLNIYLLAKYLLAVTHPTSASLFLHHKK